MTVESGRTPVAVVTGASRGLGAGLAESLAQAGFALGLCARNRPDVPPGAPGGLSRSVDVRDPVAVAEFAARVTDEVGPIDLWINNAGVLDPIGPLREAPVGALTTHVEVNLLGVMWGTRTFAGLVHDRDEPGTLVNISSGAARGIYEGWAAYCATKAAIDQLTRVVAAEEAGHGMSAFSVAPGVVDTDMQALIRSTPAERFPSVERFHQLAEHDAFNTAAWVGEQVLDLHRATNAKARPSWIENSADPVVLRIPDEPR